MARESYLAYAREIITEEADALTSMARILDEQFDAAVSLIAELVPGGRLVVSGMGKAGFIAMKVSATFASIGVPSFFLHPAEAIHGDLGRFARNDIALIFSNSGETPEILRLIPFVKRIGCPLISVTGKRESNLTKHSDVVLLTGEHNEAGPLGLAPTTSTTAMLALGDALAMALLRVRGLTREEFGRYHPGGNIGRALMLVSDVMRTGECHCVVPMGLSTREVLHRYSSAKGRPGAATIVDGDGKLAGIFTDGNLRRELDRGTEFLDRPIEELMSKNPKWIHPSQLVQEALRILSDNKIDQLVVIDEQSRPIGLVDIQDLVEFGGPASRG